MGCDFRDLVIKGIALLALTPCITCLGESCLHAPSIPSMHSGSHMRQPPWKWVLQLQPINTKDNFSPKRIRLQPHCCSVPKSFLTLCNAIDCSTPGFPVLHSLPEFAQTHFSDMIQPSHPLSSPSPPALNLSQHQGLLQCVGSSHHVAKVLELQLQYQSFQ